MLKALCKVILALYYLKLPAPGENLDLNSSGEGRETTSRKKVGERQKEKGTKPNDKPFCVCNIQRRGHIVFEHRTGGRPRHAFSSSAALDNSLKTLVLASH